MAEGYSDIPHSTYAIWKANTLGHEYDLDGSFGCQCWDYASLFWRNVGFPVGYPLTGPNLSAYEVWTVSRNANAGNEFTLITDKTALKQGDIVVLDGNTTNPPGHIAFCDEDYNGTNQIYAIGQNQGGAPSPGGGTAVTRNQIGLDLFLGAFRYNGWQQPMPVVTRAKSTSRFPWAIYASKLRAKW